MSADPRVAEENGLVAERFAAQEGFARHRDRILLKAWLNARNPRWAAVKLGARFSQHATGGDQS
jgi:hypothetical protein